ncbi:dehydrogenase domain-containing protein [Haloferula helveola]|uniref:Dehydrogenase domain-containing protein n=1 Tax=Haloferula helveola TaxID=490095 RepID=A0ABN6HHA1_9BACT|nr:dehydrogenase domain-containing protein [Haloferula helveola]
MKWIWFLAILGSPGAAMAASEVIQAFEGDGLGDWSVEGMAFGDAPVPGEMAGLNGKLTGFSGKSLVCSAHGGDEATGSLTSPPLKVKADYLAFTIAGGKHPGKTAVQMLVGDKVVLEETGNNDLMCRRIVWNVKSWRGKEVRLRILDNETGSWGVIAADHFVFDNYSNPIMPPQLGEKGVAGLVPFAGLPGSSIPQGTMGRVVANHANQDVTSPTALAFDEQGVLYVAETHRFRHGIEDNRNHLYWLLDDIASRTVEDRAAMFKKWSDKVSEKYLTEVSERVLRLDKQGDDGSFSESGVFAAEFNGALEGTMAGVFPYRGMVYVANIPSILGLVDKDGDGKADDRVVIEDGFGVRVSFSGHDLNGFELGPDGRIYGTVGDRGFNVGTREGVHYEYPNQGAVFRFDPDGSNFEVIHTGLRNPKEIAFDEYGNAFSVDNNSDQGDAARLVYVVEGADSGWRMGHQIMHSFHRQIGLEQHPPNFWMAEEMWKPANDKQPASLLPPVDNITSGPSGLAYHPGTGFLEEEVGRFLICDYRGSESSSGIQSFAVKPSGAGMKLVDSRRFMWGVCATDVTYSWDGRVFVSDFVTGWRSHEDGRVIELSAGEAYQADAARDTAKLIREGFDQRESKELVGLLKHPDMRVRTRAHLALVGKADGLDSLKEVATNGEGLERLHAIWGLGVIARRGNMALPKVDDDDFGPVPGGRQREQAQNVLVDLLKDGDPEIRAQAVKVLGDSGIVGDKINFSGLLADVSARVRMFAAISAAKTSAVGSLPFIWKMLEANSDADPYLRHAGAYALAELANPVTLTGLTTHEDKSVRLAAVVALGRKHDASVAGFLRDEDPEVMREAVRVIHDNRIEDSRSVLAELLDQPRYDDFTEMIWRRLIHSAYRVGGEANAKRLVDAAMNPKVPAPVRREALRLLGDWKKPFVVDTSTGTFDPLPERDGSALAGSVGGRVDDLLRIDGSLLEDAVSMLAKTATDLSKVDPALLKAKVSDLSLPGGARAGLLDLWAKRSGNSGKATLMELAASESDEVAFAAIGWLQKQKAPEASELLVKETESAEAARAQKAWGLLQAMEGEKVALRFAKAVDGLIASSGKGAAAIEILEGARSRPEDIVKAAVERYDAAVSKSEDPLFASYPSLLGGNAEKGARLFESHPAAQCMRCHRADGTNAADLAGPELSTVGKRLPRLKLLESLVMPGAEVASGYGVVAVTLKDGTSEGGTLVEKQSEFVELDVAGEKKRIPRDKIETISEPVSAMPPMGALLKPDELRDLVEWLSRRKGK